MEEQNIRIAQEPVFAPFIRTRTRIGYHLSESGAAEREAMREALDLVRRGRRIGAVLREWGRRTRQVASQAIRLEGRRGASGGSGALSVEDVEGDVLRCLGRYFREMTDLRQRLDTLNPPLRSDQIRIFSELLDADQKATVRFMEPLRISLSSWRQRHLAVTAESTRPLS